MSDETTQMLKAKYSKSVVLWFEHLLSIKVEKMLCINQFCRKVIDYISDYLKFYNFCKRFVVFYSNSIMDYCKKKKP